MYQQYFSCHKNFISCERECFTYEVWVVWGVLLFRDKCAGFTIKISLETLRFRGNRVPGFPVILPPLTLVVLGCYIFRELNHLVKHKNEWSKLKITWKTQQWCANTNNQLKERLQSKYEFVWKVAFLCTYILTKNNFSEKFML